MILGRLERMVGWSVWSVGAYSRLESFCDYLRFSVGWSVWSVEVYGRLERIVDWSGWSVGVVL